MNCRDDARAVVTLAIEHITTGLDNRADVQKILDATADKDGMIMYLAGYITHNFLDVEAWSKHIQLVDAK